MKGIEFYFTSVKAYRENSVVSQLDDFPHIKENIVRLDSLDFLNYANLNASFSKEEMKASFGHYDTEWNLKLGTELANYILNNY
ncbi:MAG: hypothetical protein OXH57_12345 [Ekhidna sp.]|nr:hypothetical protein [Ekhidna sp.]